jgi:hypothetical protein
VAPDAPTPLVRRMFALFREGDAQDRPHRFAVASFITWRTITSADDLTERDVRAIVDTLDYWKSCGQIVYRCRRITEKLATK